MSPIWSDNCPGVGQRYSSYCYSARTYRPCTSGGRNRAATRPPLAYTQLDLRGRPMWFNWTISEARAPYAVLTLVMDILRRLKRFTHQQRGKSLTWLALRTSWQGGMNRRAAYGVGARQCQPRANACPTAPGTKEGSQIAGHMICNSCKSRSWLPASARSRHRKLRANVRAR